MRRVEGWLLAAIVAVLLSAVASVPVLHDDDEPGGTTSAPSPSTGPGPTPLPSPTEEGLQVSGVRITTYARGSQRLVVRATVSEGVTAVLHIGPREYPLRVVGSDVSGTVAIDCADDVHELLLAVTTAAGEDLSASLGRPTTAWSSACATPVTVGPQPNPSSSSQGS